MEIKVLASGSKGNCYLISSDSSSLLIEAGIPFSEIRKKLEFKTSSLAGCLISHAHADHSKAAQDVMKAGIDVYTSEGTAKEAHLSGHRLHTIRSLAQFVIGKEWAILPFDTVHDCDEPLGFVLFDGIEKVLYATDTELLHYHFKGVTCLMVECNYSLDLIRASVASNAIPLEQKARVMGSHLSLETLVNFLKANDMSKLQSVYLLHLSDGNSDADYFKKTVEGIVGVPVYIA